MSSSTIEFSGHCLCGGVTFQGEVVAEDAVAMHCHCKDCQRATGSGFATVVAVPKSNLHVTGNYATFRVNGNSGGAVDREFCPKCGSPLFTRAELSPEQRFIKAGVLDDSSWVKPMLACWAENREDWCLLTEELDSVPQNPAITTS